MASEHPTMGTVRSVASPVSLSETALPRVDAPPPLGEHTHDILRQLGYADAQIQELADAGAI